MPGIQFFVKQLTIPTLQNAPRLQSSANSKKSFGITGRMHANSCFILPH